MKQYILYEVSDRVETIIADLSFAWHYWLLTGEVSHTHVYDGLEPSGNPWADGKRAIARCLFWVC